jgi:predicted DNA-binding protein
MNELTERFNFQLSLDEKNKLEELAELEGRTMANMLRALINGNWETYINSQKTNNERGAK